MVTQALDAGHHVTAYVRNPAKLDVTHPGLTVTAGELTDRDAIQRAVTDADAVISALGPSQDRKATEMPLIEGTRNIVEAMRATAVKRYIGMATPSLRDPRDKGSLLGRVVPLMGRTFLQRAYRELLEMSQLVIDSPLNWTIARFTRPTDGARTNIVRGGFLGRDKPRQHHPRRHRRLPRRADHRHAVPPRFSSDQQLIPLRFELLLSPPRSSLIELRGKPIAGPLTRRRRASHSRTSAGTRPVRGGATQLRRKGPERSSSSMGQRSNCGRAPL